MPSRDREPWETRTSCHPPAVTGGDPRRSKFLVEDDSQGSATGPPAASMPGIGVSTRIVPGWGEAGTRGRSSASKACASRRPARRADVEGDHRPEGCSNTQRLGGLRTRRLRVESRHVHDRSLVQVLLVGSGGSAFAVYLLQGACKYPCGAPKRRRSGPGWQSSRPSTSSESRTSPGKTQRAKPLLKRARPSGASRRWTSWSRPLLSVPVARFRSTTPTSRSTSVWNADGSTADPVVDLSLCGRRDRLRTIVPRS